MPTKKDKTKQKQKQIQSQNVVVNVAYHHKKRGPSKRQQQPQASNSKPIQQPQQQLSQAIPYLGLQSANNAQLLNTIHTSLTALYSQHNKQLTSVPPSNGFQAPRLIPQPPAPPTVVNVHQASTPAPAPPVVNVNTPAPVVNVHTPAQPAPIVNIQTPAPPAARRFSDAPVAVRAPINTNTTHTPIAPPSIIQPSTPQAEFIPLGEPAQRRRSVEFSDNPSPALPPPPVLVDLLVREHGLKYNKNGSVNQRSREWNKLPVEVKDKILAQQQKPVKAKLIPDDPNTVMLDDAASVKLVTKRKKAPANLEIDEDAELEEYVDKSYKSARIPKAMDAHKIHTHTEMKPESHHQQKSFLGLFPPSNKVVPTTYDDTDTDYGNDITSEVDI